MGAIEEFGAGEEALFCFFIFASFLRVDLST